MNIWLMAINNKGEMAGWFVYGKYNYKQKKLVAAGHRIFFWDGSVHVLPIPHAKYASVSQTRLNNKSMVMVTQYVNERINGYDKEVTYLWDHENGLQVVPDFRGVDLNDSSTVLGFMKAYPSWALEENGDKCAIWRNGQFNVLSDLLGFKDLENMSTPFSDSYAVEKIQDPVAINNKGQIVCLGYVWGEWHPCILEPTGVSKKTLDQ